MLGVVLLADPLDQDVAHLRAGTGGQEGVAVRGGELVVPGDDHGVVDAGLGVPVLVELPVHLGADHLVRERLTDDGGHGRVETELRRQRADAGDVSAVVGRSQGDKLAHLVPLRVSGVRAALEPQIPAGRRTAALGVPDDVDLAGAGGLQDAVDVARDLPGRSRDGAGGLERTAGRPAVVGGEYAVALPLQPGREHAPVVEGVRRGPVQQHDRAGVLARGTATPVVGPGRRRFRVEEAPGQRRGDVEDLAQRTGRRRGVGCRRLAVGTDGQRQGEARADRGPSGAPPVRPAPGIHPMRHRATPRLVAGRAPTRR